MLWKCWNRLYLVEDIDFKCILILFVWNKQNKLHYSSWNVNVVSLLAQNVILLLSLCLLPVFLIIVTKKKKKYLVNFSSEQISICYMRICLWFLLRLSLKDYGQCLQNHLSTLLCAGNITVSIFLCLDFKLGRFKRSNPADEHNNNNVNNK